MSAQTIDFQADPRVHRESGFVPQHMGLRGRGLRGRSTQDCGDGVLGLRGRSTQRGNSPCGIPHRLLGQVFYKKNCGDGVLKEETPPVESHIGFLGRSSTKTPCLLSCPSLAPARQV